MTVKYDPKALDNYGMGLPVAPTDPRERTPHQSRIDDFMWKAGQEVPDSPSLPSKEVRLLRAKLVFEEAVRELIVEGLGVGITLVDVEGGVEFQIGRQRLEVSFDDCFTPDLQLIADGCADTSVVTIGTLSACGIADARLLEEVDRSNLSKFIVPKCSVHGRDMVDLRKSSGHYTCVEIGCNQTAEGPYRSAEGKWVKGPQYSPADIAGVLKRQMLPKPPIGCIICHEPVLGDLLVCYDHAKSDGTGEDAQPRNPTMSEAVLATKKEFGIVLLGAKHGVTKKLVPNPLGGVPVDLTTLHPTHRHPITEDSLNKRRAADAGPRYDSGGITLCPHCKGPLNDEGMKKLRAGIFSVIECPNCMRGSTLEQVENA